MAWTSSLLFHNLCSVFENILHKQDTKIKEAILKKSFQLEDSNNLPQLYSSLRLLFPSLDLDRPAYGIQEKILVKIYVESFNLPSSQNERLMNYKVSKSQCGFNCVVGDFSSVLCSTLTDRISTVLSTLTVEDVNTVLDCVATASGSLVILIFF
jgi:hypothetical protein